MNNIVDTLIETERTLMRPFRLDDAPGMFELNSNPKVLKHTGDVSFKSIEAARQFIEQYRQIYATDYGRFSVLRKRDQAYIGWCGFRTLEEDINIGFRFLEQHWNQGYATECAKACLDWIKQREGARAVIGRALPENTASIRVLEKLGMTLWKTGRCDDFEGALLYRIEF